MAGENGADVTSTAEKQGAVAVGLYTVQPGDRAGEVQGGTVEERQRESREVAAIRVQME